jgi:hypothetical protein
MQELEHVPSFNSKVLVLTIEVFIIYCWKNVDHWRHDCGRLEFVVVNEFDPLCRLLQQLHVSTEEFINGNLKQGSIWSLELDITRLGWNKLKPYDTIDITSCKRPRRRKGKYLLVDFL